MWPPQQGSKKQPYAQKYDATATEPLKWVIVLCLYGAGHWTCAKMWFGARCANHQAISQIKYIESITSAALLSMKCFSAHCEVSKGNPQISTSHSESSSLQSNAKASFMLYQYQQECLWFELFLTKFLPHSSSICKRTWLFKNCKVLDTQFGWCTHSLHLLKKLI